MRHQEEAQDHVAEQRVVERQVGQRTEHADAQGEAGQPRDLPPSRREEEAEERKTRDDRERLRALELRKGSQKMAEARAAVLT